MMDKLIVVAATSLEARAARRELPHQTVLEAGVALRGAGTAFGGVVVSCGLAGGLRDDLPTGTVVIPRSVRRPDGTTLQCDPELVEALIAGARRIGHEPSTGAMVTADTVVVGRERAVWAADGFVAADMETGLLVATRVAAVRVILDTPRNELSADWLHPVAAMLKPWNWPQAVWLAREAPRCSRVAACVIAAALMQFSGE
jgi:Phosphorylase superfamily